MKTFTMDGYVCGSIDTRYTNSGKGVTSFSVNSPDRRKSQTGEWETVPQFFRCEYWHRGERDFRPASIVDKAHLVLIGSPKYEEWEGQGGKRTSVKFVCSEVFPVQKGQKAQTGAYPHADAPAYDENIPF